MGKSAKALLSTKQYKFTFHLFVTDIEAEIYSGKKPTLKVQKSISVKESTVTTPTEGEEDKKEVM